MAVELSDGTWTQNLTSDGYRGRAMWSDYEGNEYITVFNDECGRHTIVRSPLGYIHRGILVDDRLPPRARLVAFALTPDLDALKVLDVALGDLTEWQDETVQVFYRAMVANTARDRAAILADTLEEAGYDDADVLAVLRAAPTRRVYCAADPNLPSNELWHFVYLHGHAEEVAAVLTSQFGWDYGATDLCVVEGPHPTEPGEYPVSLYGRPAVAILADRAHPGRLSGRIALLSDKTGLAHARHTQDWR